jgi:exosortase K
MLQTKILQTSKSSSNDLPYYGFIAFIFIVFKLLYKSFGNEELLLLLTPVSYLIGFFTDSPLIFSIANGYYLLDLNILIDASCSGFNFWLISFVVLGFAIVTNVIDKKRKSILLILSLLMTYFLTIIANTSRIISIIKMNNLLPNLNEKYDWLHTTQGTFVYLFFLIGFYLISLKFLKDQ